VRDWKAVKLGQICRLINGRAYKQHELLEAGPVPVLRVGNFFTNRSWYYSDLQLEPDKYCDNGDLLYAWSASFGPRVWEGGKAIFHYHIWKVEPDLSQVDKRFLFHFFDWDKESIHAEQGTGTTMIHVTKGSMEERKLALPPLPEQQRIVALLDEAFAGLAVAAANAEKNLKNAREVFESYLNSVFTQKNEGWPIKALNELAQVQSGGTPLRSNKAFWVGSIPWYSSGELNRLHTSEPERHVSPEGIENSNAKIFPKGSLLIGMYDTAAMKMSICDRDSAFNQAIAGVRPNSNLDMVYLLHALLAIKPRILEQRRSVRQKNLSLEKIKNISIPTPSIEIQRGVASQFMGMRNTAFKLEILYRQKLATIAELKQALLQKAFAGELTKEVSSKVVALPLQKISLISSTDLHAGILAIAFQKHIERGSEKTFGHVKSEKMAHFAEAWAGIDLDRTPIKDAAGPNDFPHFLKVESRAKKAGFFTFRKTGESHLLEKGNGFDGVAKRAKEALGERYAAIEKLSETLAKMNTEQAEIFATVFAAWNNLLIDQSPITDETIVTEARENWHPNKLRIDRDKFFKAIVWMRNQGFVPTGRGKKVEAKA
jgi:type I restriction enzyme, S subunit